MPMSAPARLEEAIVAVWWLLKSIELVSFGDFRWGNKIGSRAVVGSALVFAAMFFSEAVIPCWSVLSVSSMGMSESVGNGISRTDRGRLPWGYLRGLSDANFTGDGDNDGLFSLEAPDMFSFSSLISSSLSESSVIVLWSWPWCSCCMCPSCCDWDCESARPLLLLRLAFMVNEETRVSVRDRTERESAISCSLTTVPASSPLSFASITASFSSVGTGAWMDVISLA